MPYDPQASLQQFYGNITDRGMISEQIKWEKENNPAMAGLNESQIGKVLNASIGAEKGSKFEMFDSKTRWLDALGYYANEAFTGAPTTPGDWMTQMQGGATRDLGDVGADVGGGVARMVGVNDPEGKAMWEEAGRGIPAGLGTLALGAIPVVGLPMMLGSSYGKAVNDAKAQGASGGQAMAVGAIDAGVNLLFLKAGGPLMDKFTTKAVNVVGKATLATEKATASEALAALSGLTKKGTGEALTGRALLQFGKESGNLTAAQAFKARLAAEAATEGVQIGAGIAGQIAHEGILDAETLKQHMADPNYWATTLLTEGVFSVLGTTLGRIRKPNDLAGYEKLPTGEAATVDPSLPLFAKAAETGDDAAVIAADKDAAAQAASKQLRETIDASAGEEALLPIADTPADAIAKVSDALIATGRTSINGNQAQEAAVILATQSPDIVNSLLNDALTTPLPRGPEIPGIRNLEIGYQKVKFQVGDDPTPVELNRDLLLEPTTVFARPEEQALHQQFQMTLQSKFDQPTYFDASIDDNRKLGYTGFLESSGLGEAAKRAGISLRFTNVSKQGDWVDRILSRSDESAQLVGVGDKAVVYVNAKGNNRDADLHELGHAVDYTISRGGFGPEMLAEWQKLKESFAGRGGDSLGATVSSKIVKGLGPRPEGMGKGITEPSDFSAHYAKLETKHSEWAAQAFQGYMLTKPSKFKSFVETNFPRVHEFFTKAADALRKTLKITLPDVKSMWNPGYAEGNKFFESLFANATRDDANTQLRTLVDKHKLSPKITESLIEAVSGTTTLAGRKLAFDAVERWVKLPTPIESDLLDQLAFVNSVNKSTITLTDLMTPSVAGLPNVKRLMSIDTVKAIADATARIPSDATPEKVAELEQYIANLKDLPVRGMSALEAIDRTLANKVKMIEPEFGDTSLLDTAISMMMVDHQIGRWMRGELPGQKGRYMWDKGTPSGTFYRNNKDVNKVIADKEREIHFAKEFPLLQKAIRSIKTGENAEKFVAVNGELKSGDRIKRKVFESLEEAQDFAEIYNNAGKYPGYSFSPKGVPRTTTDPISKKKTTEIKYVVRGRKDDRKTLVAEYRDDLHNIDNDVFDRLADEPEVRANSEAKHEEYSVDAVYDDYDVYMEKAVKRNFAAFRRGENIFPEKATKAFNKLLDYIGKEDYFWNAMKDGFGIKSDNFEDVLLAMANRAESKAKDVKIYYVNAPEEVQVAIQNFVNVHKLWGDKAIQDSKAQVMRGEIPKVKNDKKGWTMLEHGMTPLNDPNFHAQVPVFQHADVLGIHQKNKAGIQYSLANPRHAVGRSVAMLEKLHQSTYGGAQTIANTNPVFEPFGRMLREELPQQRRQGSLLTRILRGEGELVDTPQGKQWIPNLNSEKKDDKVYLAIEGSPRLKPLVDKMRRMSNEAGGIKFADVASGNLEVGRRTNAEDKKIRADLQRQANELISKNFDMQNPKHVAELQNVEAYLARTYAFQEQNAHNAYNAENELHRWSVANTLASSLDFNRHPSVALDIATQLHAIPIGDPNGQLARKMILTKPVAEGGMGWDDRRALSFDDKFIAAKQRIDEMHKMMLESPGYVKEQRMRRWLVSYTKPKGDKVETGLRDFDTEAEAWKFMQNMPEGAKLDVKRPIDQHEKGNQYRAGSDLLEEVVNKVTAARQDMLGWMLQDKVDKGLMTKADKDNLVKTMSGMSEDILSDLATSSMGDVVNVRKFSDGRDELDMAYQQEIAGWRSATRYSRQITDAGFALHMQDPAIAAFPKEKQRMQHAKEELRIPDGDAQRAAGKTAFSYFILGNVSSAMIEALQWPLSLSHILVEGGAGILEAFTTPSRMMAKAAKASAARILKGSDQGIWEGSYADLIKYAEDGDQLSVRPLNDISTDNFERQRDMDLASANPGAQNAKAKIPHYANAAYEVLNKFYAGFSRINAELSLVSAYEVLRKKKFPKGEPTGQARLDLFEEAITLSNKANGTWGRSNRPWWFNTESTTGRTVAQLAWSLQGFASNHVANHLRLVKKSLVGKEWGYSPEETKQARKALAVMTTIQVAGLGVMGHTLAAGTSKLLTATFGYDPETDLREWLEDKEGNTPEERLALADLVSYGAFHAAGVPIDFQSRVAVGGLGPLNAYDGFNGASFGGPLLSTAAGIADAWKTVAKGDMSPESVMRYGTSLLPTGIQRGIRQELFDDGKVYNKAGKLVLEPSGIERVAAVLGFASKDYTNYMRSKTKQLEANAADGTERSHAAAQIRTLLTKGQDFEALQRLQGDAKRLGMEPKDLAARVAELEIQQTFGPGSSTGRGPNAQRAAALYPNQLPQPSKLDTKRLELKTLQRLQQLPDAWQRQMFNAQLQDTAQAMLPGGDVRNALRDPVFKMNAISTMRQGNTMTRPVAGGLAGLIVNEYGQ